jgi:hypothetical protein
MDSRLERDGRAAACVYEPVTLDSYRLRGFRHAGKQRALRSSSNRFLPLPPCQVKRCAK